MAREWVVLRRQGAVWQPNDVPIGSFCRLKIGHLLPDDLDARLREHGGGREGQEGVEG